MCFEIRHFQNFGFSEVATPGIVSGDHRKLAALEVRKMLSPYSKRMPDKVRFRCLGKLSAELRDWFSQMFNLNDAIRKNPITIDKVNQVNVKLFKVLV